MSEKNWSEFKTRKEFTDKLLLNSSWNPIIKFNDGKNYESGVIGEHSTQNEPCDYALFYKSKPLAVVEEKKVAVGTQNVPQ